MLPSSACQCRHASRSSKHYFRHISLPLSAVGCRTHMLKVAQFSTTSRTFLTCCRGFAKLWTTPIFSFTGLFSPKKVVCPYPLTHGTHSKLVSAPFARKIWMPWCVDAAAAAAAVLAMPVSPCDRHVATSPSLTCGYCRFAVPCFFLIVCMLPSHDGRSYC